LNSFSLALTVEALQGKTCQDSLLSEGGRSVLAKISGERGRPWGIFLVSTKLDTFCYLIRPCKLHRATCRRFDTIPACDRQTDGRTDGQTDGIVGASTALAMRTLRGTVKMADFYFKSSGGFAGCADKSRKFRKRFVIYRHVLQY